jgi:hypothetical protein
MISANQIKHHTIVGIEDILGVTLQCLLCLLFLTWNLQGPLTQHNVNCEDFWAKLQFCIRILIYALLIITLSRILRIACYALLCLKSEEILELIWENRFKELRNPLTLSLTLSDIIWNRPQIPDPNFCINKLKSDWQLYEGWSFANGGALLVATF